ncbi:MAG: hypothetical protein ABSH28_00600 [Acidobacteriota bacterium]|jgi:hypothetical protein
MDDLITRKAFPDAVVLAEEAVRSMLRMREGERWDPRSGLILRERSFRYDGEKDPAIASFLKRWIKVTRAAGDEETACSLDL